MAKARAIIKRRKAVQNTRKITRTMQLIATAQYQAAYNRAMRTKPYTERIAQLVSQVSAGGADIEHPLLKVNTEAKRSRLIVMTSNRGLCGGYNGSIIRAAIEHMQAREAEGETVDLWVMGKKGMNYFNFLGREMAYTDTRFEDNPHFADVEPIAVDMMEAYERGEIDAVHVAFMKFVSTGVQQVEVQQLLPIEKPEPAEDHGEAASGEVQYEFTPPREELLAELLPETVKVRLFQCFSDAGVSEQVARMVAMKAATDAASDMIKTLGQQYNRARQSQITLELLDIVSGAEALK